MIDTGSRHNIIATVVITFIMIIVCTIKTRVETCQFNNIIASNVSR